MDLSPEILLSAYAQGAFPMSDHDGRIRWYTADPRGVLPLDDRFHVPKTLGQLLRKNPPVFDVRIDFDFEATMRACMNARAGATWISDELVAAYVQLHRVGFAHSIECWQVDKKEGKPVLVGGFYGVNLGAAFFGESMFHTVRDASKVALIHLVEHLRCRRFELLDTQANTHHLSRFGCLDVPASVYLEWVRDAVTKTREFL